MAIYSFNKNLFQEIKTTTFNHEGILERQHIQFAIKNQLDIIAPDCLVISEEFSEWSESQRRIDLLAIDKDGNLVVIELKRTETGEQMELQALRYAAMVSTLTFSRAIEIYQRYLLSINSMDNSEERLLNFLNWEEPREEEFALDVRIILVSANFSKELTTSVMWLNERNLDIRCIRLVPYKYKEEIIIDVQQIIPLPEVESYQIKIKQQSEERREARKGSKDYTKYIFQGNSFNKRKLVLTVVHQWIKDNKPNTIAELLKAFPLDIFIPLDEAIYNSKRKDRHFLGDDEILEFSDLTKYAISNQWGRGNIENFINHARKLNYEIEEVQ